jgi:hypothetical protein
MGIRQSADSKSAQPDLRALDAPRSRPKWRKGATESISIEILMERHSSHVIASLCRHLVCEFFGALQGVAFETEVDGIG